MSQEKQDDDKECTAPTSQLSRYDEDDEVEDNVAEIIDSVLELVNLDISSKTVKLIENGLMAEVAMYKLNEIVHLATVDHDGKLFPDQVLELLVPDEEPLPPPVDSWARGLVPARVIKVHENRFNEVRGLTDGTRTPSVSSYRSSSTRSRSTTQSRNVTSRGAARQIATSENDAAPRIIELDDETNSYFGDNGANMNGTGHMYDMLQKQKNRLKQLTHTDDTVKDEFQLLQEEVDRAAEDLKGKNYIFDQNGQIVLIQPLKSDQLPPFSFNPSLNVNNVDSTQVDDRRNKAGGVGIPPQPKKKKKLRVAGSRNLDDTGERALFVPTTSLATTIAGNSHDIQVNNGVAIETNKLSKEGPPIAVDPRKPSRKEYFHRKAATVSASLDSSWGNKENGVKGEDSFHSSGFDPTDMSQSMGGNSSTFTAGNAFKDINPLEGGRPKALGGAPDTHRSSQSQSSRRASEDNGKKGKQNPALEPTKPSYEQQTTVNLLHGGNHMQGPRDRLPSQILSTRADKKKYVISTKPSGSGDRDELDSQSFSSFASKKSSGTIKKERLAQGLF